MKKLFLCILLWGAMFISVDFISAQTVHAEMEFLGWHHRMYGRYHYIVYNETDNIVVLIDSVSKGWNCYEDSEMMNGYEGCLLHRGGAYIVYRGDTVLMESDELFPMEVFVDTIPAKQSVKRIASPCIICLMRLYHQKYSSMSRRRFLREVYTKCEVHITLLGQEYVFSAKRLRQKKVRNDMNDFSNMI